MTGWWLGMTGWWLGMTGWWLGMTGWLLGMTGFLLRMMMLPDAIYLQQEQITTKNLKLRA
ncbi:MAG: hypothetical protein E7019_06425 [Alphaproteobacteria bacterium]|nr:hypothetical protein [Alphaproteobacteria bacterium]